MLPQQHCLHRQTWHTTEVAAPARSNGLGPVAILLYVAYSCPFIGLYLLRNPREYVDYNSVTDSRDGRLSWPGWLIYSGQFSHRVLTTMDRVQGRERQLDEE